MPKRSNESSSSDLKKQRIEKSLDVLLSEVFSSEFEDFRAYLAQEQIKELALRSKNLGTKPLNLLAEALKGTSVTTVNLSWNLIGDDGAKDFAAGLKGTSVTTVNLWGNQIGDAGAKDFAASLKNTSVTTVDLTFNQIGDDGARDFAAGLKGTSVTTVDLTFNQIGPAGAKDFAAGLKGTSVTTVDFRGNFVIGDEGARSLLAVIPETKLTKLELDVHNNISSELLQEIKNALDKNKLRLKEVPIMLMAMPTAPEANPELLSDKKYETCQNPSEQLMYAAQILHALPPEIGQLIIAEAMRQTPAAILANYNNFAAQRAKVNHEMLEVLLEAPADPQKPKVERYS